MGYHWKNFNFFEKFDHFGKILTFFENFNFFEKFQLIFEKFMGWDPLALCCYLSWQIAQYVAGLPQISTFLKNFNFFGKILTFLKNFNFFEKCELIEKCDFFESF